MSTIQEICCMETGKFGPGNCEKWMWMQQSFPCTMITNNTGVEPLTYLTLSHNCTNIYKELQYHCCWCPGSMCHQVPSSHWIDGIIYADRTASYLVHVALSDTANLPGIKESFNISMDKCKKDVTYMSCHSCTNPSIYPSNVQAFSCDKGWS